MKRSEINIAIASAIEFFARHQFALPPFASWTRETWAELDEVSEFASRELGWDVTDFNSGNFESIGLTLFALRNGIPSKGNQCMYSEKIMHVRERQVTPLHFHYRKTEDIINRGGKGTGDLAVQLYNSTADGGLADTPVVVTCDGFRRHCKAGGTIFLRHGESITITPRLYHTFHAVGGPGLIGEVSTLNSDSNDNHFFEPIPRYPEVVEDEAPLRLLCTEYPVPQQLASQRVTNSQETNGKNS
ncbi:MAG TPA: D-lyxose/D-mannose family sugar isomerase [Acidisarcina sp.]|nr:D-lyxose/D-mannose family sugar isomerase [Acidisarcina sp.]